MTRSEWRTARRPHRCEYGHQINIGDRYLISVVSPNHDGLGNVGWWTLRHCQGCGTQYHQMEAS